MFLEDKKLLFLKIVQLNNIKIILVNYKNHNKGELIILEAMMNNVIYAKMVYIRLKILNINILNNIKYNQLKLINNINNSNNHINNNKHINNKYHINNNQQHNSIIKISILEKMENKR